jgi:hypothetical protein
MKGETQAYVEMRYAALVTFAFAMTLHQPAAEDVIP